MSGIDFTLSANDGGEDAEALVVESTDADGLATFYEVGAGPYTLTEAMPTGYGRPIVYYHQIEGEAVNLEANDGGTIEFNMNDHDLICDWYNVPTDDGSITIYKYTCPYGYDFDAAGADPKTDCVRKTNGIDFGFSSPTFGEIVITTGSSFDGGWTIGSLNPDTYRVNEYLPDGPVDTFVTCQWIEDLGPYVWNSINPYDPIGTGVGSQIDLDLPKYDNIVCQWYNVPERHEGGELVVIKYWCDGNIYDEAHCELYGGGANFGLQAASGPGDPIFFSTGWDGTAHLYLPPGNYDLWESDFEWCKAESDQVNANGEVEIFDEQTSYVTVYNCGPDKDKEPPVKKFPNTGAGSGTMNQDAGFNGMTIMMIATGTLMMVAVAGIATRTRTTEVRMQA